MTQSDGNIQSWQQDIDKWKSDLSFCAEEVKVLKRYLNDVNEQSLTHYMKEDIAHFKVRLSETMEKAHVLLDEVLFYGRTLPSEPFNERGAAAHSAMRERTSSFCKSYAALKSGFVRFLAKSEMLIS